MMLKFLKSEVVQGKEGAQLVDLKCSDGDNWLPLNEMDIGMGIRLALSKVKNDSRRKELRLGFRHCFTSIATYLQTTLPLTNSFLKDLSCLQPKTRTIDKGKSAISRLFLQMKKVTKTNDFCDRVQAELLLYMSDSILNSLQSDFETSGNICAYWQKVSEVSDGMGGRKYESLSYVAWLYKFQVCTVAEYPVLCSVLHDWFMLTECMDFLCFEPCETDKMSWNCPEIC